MAPAQACDDSMKRLLGSQMTQWLWELETRAEAGDEEARSILYDYYTDGCLTEPDLEQAERWAPTTSGPGLFDPKKPNELPLPGGQQRF